MFQCPALFDGEHAAVILLLQIKESRGSSDERKPSDVSQLDDFFVLANFDRSKQ